MRWLVRHGGNPVGGVNNVIFRRTAFDAVGGMGRRAIAVQQEFVTGLRRANADIVRPSDRLCGALRAPLTRLRHHVLLAAAGPAQCTSRKLATRLLGAGRGLELR